MQTRSARKYSVASLTHAARKYSVNLQAPEFCPRCDEQYLVTAKRKESYVRRNSDSFVFEENELVKLQKPRHTEVHTEWDNEAYEPDTNDVTCADKSCSGATTDGGVTELVHPDNSDVKQKLEADKDFDKETSEKSSALKTVAHGGSGVDTGTQEAVREVKGKVTFTTEEDSKPGPAKTEEGKKPTASRTKSSPFHSWLTHCKNKHGGRLKHTKHEIVLEAENRSWLADVENKFIDLADEDLCVDMEGFKKAVGLKKPSHFIEQLFRLLDTDKSGKVDISALMDLLSLVVFGTDAEVFEVLAYVFDTNDDGFLGVEEFHQILKTTMEKSSLQLNKEDTDALATAFFHEVDPSHPGYISVSELHTVLEEYPTILAHITASARNALRMAHMAPDHGHHYGRYFTVRYQRENVKKVCFLLVYCLINIGFFTLNVMRYKGKSAYYRIAKGCGMALNFNCSFILVLVLRFFLTWLRRLHLVHYLPMDQHVLLHKIVGGAIAFFATGHTVMHFANFYVASSAPNATLLYHEYLFTTKANIGFVYGTTPLTGFALDVILIIMVACALPCVRQKGHFELFYWTHILYVVFWPLIVVHATSYYFLYLFILPGLVFLIEKIYRNKWIRKAIYGKTYILQANLLSSKVTNLVLTRPHNFRYQPGDYIFLQVPAIARHEWHPFTLSSAPEMEDKMTVHIRSLGNWSKKIYDYIDAIGYAENLKRRSKEKGQTLIERPVPKPIKDSFDDTLMECFIDGPYGTPTRGIFESEHAVLIAAGIGVTPFASILQSIVRRYRRFQRTCHKCNHSWLAEIPHDVMRLKKVDFIWINRDQRSFEWFLALLAELEMEQASQTSFERFLEMHLFMTSALSRDDITSLQFQLALEVLFTEKHKDIITGLHTRTEPGKPDWDQLFTDIKEQRKGHVKVFVCGPGSLASTIKDKCFTYGFSLAKEYF